MMTTELELREKSHERAEAFEIADAIWESAVNGDMKDWPLEKVREALEDGYLFSDELYQEIIDGIAAEREHKKAMQEW